MNWLPSTPQASAPGSGSRPGGTGPGVAAASPRLGAVVGGLLLAGGAGGAGANDAPLPEGVAGFLDRHCLECHDSGVRKGELDLEGLGFDLGDHEAFRRWLRVYDRVVAGEMPPEKKRERPGAAERDRFAETLAAAFVDHERRAEAAAGRSPQRRLNRFEYENTLRDLLGVPWLEVKDMLPEDGQAHGFRKSGDALDVSHVQMNRYLQAAEFALRSAMAPASERPERTTTRYHTWDQREFTSRIHLGGPKFRRTFPVVGTELQADLVENGIPRRRVRPPEDQLDEEGMVVLVSTYEPTEVRFGGFRAPVSGRYRLLLCAQSVWMAADFASVAEGRRPEPVTLYSDTDPRILRKLGSFDAGTEPTVGEFDVFLLAGETVRPDAARLHRSRPPDHRNPLLEEDGMPAVSFRWLEVDGPVTGEWPPESHRLLFGDLPVRDLPAAAPDDREGRPGGGRRRRPRFQPPPGVEVESDGPEADARGLVSAFLERAYRRPPAEADVERFAALAGEALDAGHGFTDAVLAAYTAVLSSPKFLYLDASPGDLDGPALADRLAFFLWNSAPDAELREVAAGGLLVTPETLRAQADRLLDDPRSRRFTEAFLDDWLDLRRIAATAPDAELYPDYQLDDLLVESMVDETREFFRELVARNLGAGHLVASDFAILNERLAAHYGLGGVEGVHLRPVSLPGTGVRGGLLTQASVLKVTANGTTTSPVVRGTWVMDRLLGLPPQPPPPSVPAVEPDIRGATTIREQLDLHREQESCNACHRHIDPAGFALESFDVMGAFRDRYRTAGAEEPVEGIGHDGLFFRFGLGPAVDPSGMLPDGRGFADVRELRAHLLTDEAQLARNLVAQLVAYATGAPVRFSDRPVVGSIVEEAAPGGYGVRDLIHGVVQSPLFRKM